MNHGKYVFSQLMEFVDLNEFRKCVNRYNGNYKVRTFTCWHQFLCLSFGQMTHRESLSDIVTCLNAQRKRLHHLGIRSKVAKSTLADANIIRSWQIYADFTQVLIQQARELYRDSLEVNQELDQTVYALDSSLIRLCISVFGWANYRKTVAGIKLHTILNVHTAIPDFINISDGKLSDMTILKTIVFELNAFYVMDRGYMDLKELFRIELEKAFFVIRAKKDIRFKRQYSRDKSGQASIVYDQIGRFVNYQPKKSYPKQLRFVKSCDPETGKTILLLTNHMDLPAEAIATMYRQRWKIELFFKWIKQNLRIKTFWGETENAVKTQIWIAIATYLIVAIAKKKLGLNINLYQMLQIISISPFDKTPINQLLNMNSKIGNDPIDRNQLNIF